MNVVIQIHYISVGGKSLRRGSFPLKRKKKETVAMEFWKWIKGQHPFECTIEKVIIDGEDITDSIINLDKTPLD